MPDPLIYLPLELAREILNLAVLDHSDDQSGPDNTCLSTRAVNHQWDDETALARGEDLFGLDDWAPLPMQRKQWCAARISRLFLDVEYPLDFVRSLGVTFQHLQQLEVRSEMYDENEPDEVQGSITQITHLMQPSLQTIDVDDNIRTDNFLPALSTVVGLRELSLKCQAFGSTTQDLLSVVNSCRQLEDLSLKTGVDLLVNDQVFASIATLSRLVQVCLQSTRITCSMSGLLLASNIQHFASMQRLHLHNIDSDALEIIRGLETLTRLSLGINGTQVDFTIFASAIHLETLELRFNDPIRLTYDHLSPLHRLTKLTDLQIGSAFTVDTTLIRDHHLAEFFRLLPQLTKAVLSARIANDSSLFGAIGASCKELQSLLLHISLNLFRVPGIHDDRPCLFPSLDTLIIVRLVDPGGERHWYLRVREATLLLRSACPQLRELRWSALGDQFTDAVCREWHLRFG